MKLLPTLSLILLPLVAACTTLTPAPAEQQAAAHSPSKPGMGKIFIYRSPSFRGGAVVNNVYLDGRIVGVIGQAKFMVANVTPGEHIASCGTETVPFRISAGETKHFETDVHWNLSNPEQQGEIKAVTPEVAHERSARCEQVAANF